jgi:L1 cell adhesion molecule like protein
LEVKKITSKLDKELNEEKSSEKLSIRREHRRYIESCFDEVLDENELKVKHEKNKKLLIDKYIALKPLEDEEKEALNKMISDEIDDDFEYLVILYKLNKKDLNSENNMQALANAKNVYVREMDKHFLKSEFIVAQELQDLHEKYRNLAQNQLKTDLIEKGFVTRVSKQFDRIVDIIYDQYKRQNLMNIPLKPAIGIDLGTTYSCVGVINRGKVNIIPNTYGENITPSYVAFDEDEEELVGSYAKDQAFENPVNTIFDVKRMIGRKYSDYHIQNDLKLWPFDVINENEMLKIQLHYRKKTTLYPEEVSAKILARLKSDAENYLGFKVKNAVITVPAYFNDAQRQATKDAGVIAGLKVLQILNEPTAAAIAYSHQIKDEIRKNVLIYDLGGGTFDVAVVVIDKADIDVRAVGGDTHLGGIDFDRRIFDFCYKKFEDNFRKETKEFNRKRALARLRMKCEKLKCHLTELSSATISIDELLPGWDFKYTMTRSKFEDICIDLFKKTIRKVDETLRSADMKAIDINDVVLIGGSTRIPKIQSLLKEYFHGKHLNKEIRPDEAVAYGATIQASLLNGEKFIDSNLALIHDVSPFSLGIEIKDKTMAVIIPRNSKLPVIKSQKCFTAEDNQTFVLIQVFEGEDKIAKQNRLLGEFVIEGLPKRAAGMVTVDVTMEIDEEGILHIRGETTDKSANITIKDHRGRISPEQLKSLIKQD